MVRIPWSCVSLLTTDNLSIKPKVTWCTWTYLDMLRSYLDQRKPQLICSRKDQIFILTVLRRWCINCESITMSIFLFLVDSDTLHRMSWDWNLAFMPYSQTWRDHRREFHQFFNPREVVKYQPIQLRECRAFLRRILVAPHTDLGQNVRQYVSSSLTFTISLVNHTLRLAHLPQSFWR